MMNAEKWLIHKQLLHTTTPTRRPFSMQAPTNENRWMILSLIHATPPTDAHALQYSNQLIVNT